MKNTLLICLACCFGCMTAPTLFAQDCTHYLFLQKNKTIEMTIYNKKGDPNGKQVYQVSDVNTQGGVTTGHLTSEMFDKKGKSIAKANSNVKCNGGIMMVDMKMMMPQQQAEQLGKTEAKAESAFMEYPSKMQTGDALKDGNLTMDINTSGLAETVTMVISDRKVLAKETITTEAGTWECYKISYKCKMTVKMGPFPINTNLDGIEWYAPGFGVVKSQSKYGGTAITSIK